MPLMSQAGSRQGGSGRTLTCQVGQHLPIGGGGRFITTKPLCRSRSTRWAAVILAMSSSDSLKCFRPSNCRAKWVWNVVQDLRDTVTVPWCLSRVFASDATFSLSN